MNPAGVTLAGLGWTPERAAAFEPFGAAGLIPGRVGAQHTQIYRVYTADSDVLARVSGRFRHEAARPADFPAVGDWVAVEARGSEGAGLIHAVLPRRSQVSRRAAGPDGGEQVLAANVDTVFLVMGLDANYNPRRLERALVVIWESGAAPVVLLSKADVCEDAAARVREVEALAAGVPVHAVSPLRGDGLELVRSYLAPGRTVALLGSSGVGKSTLINRLLGREALRTRAVRGKDQRGRHTTTHRELVLLPEAGLVIDTPGLRELQLWAEGEALAGTFDDVQALSAGCSFRDCAHESEPGCAVRRAAEEGRLAPERLESWRKLQRELRHLETQGDWRAQQTQRRKWRSIHKATRNFKPRG